MRTGRVDFKGKFNEEVSFRLRTRFDKDAKTTQNQTDGFSSQIDYAYVQNTLTDGLKLILGKFASEIGSVEGRTSSSDIYMQSQVYRQISGNGFLYVSGAKLLYTYGDHEGSVFVINQSDTTTTEQSKSAYGFAYAVSLNEKTLTPIIGYLFDEKQSSTSDTKLTTTISSVGLKWEPKPYFIYADYLIYAQKNISAVAVDDTWTSLILEAGYDFEGVIPRIKYEMSEKKTGPSAEKYDGVTLGVEYKPYPQDIYRYHLMITQMTTKPEVGDARFEQRLLVGVRILADFLK
jgi:hypothetical protein